MCTDICLSIRQFTFIMQHSSKGHLCQLYTGFDIIFKFVIALMLLSRPVISCSVATGKMTPGTEDGVVAGNVSFTQDGDQVLVEYNINGLGGGFHGFHIHEKVAAGPDCKAAGGHFKGPDNHSHGGLNLVEPRHYGDLGNIGGHGEYEALVGELRFPGLVDDIVDRAIVVHALEDDLGKGGDESSLANGNAGARVACGPIQCSEGDSSAAPYLAAPSLLLCFLATATACAVRAATVPSR